MKKKEKSKARASAARTLGVSGRMISDAKTVKEKAPELEGSVSSGDIGVATAAEIARTPRVLAADSLALDFSSFSLMRVVANLPQPSSESFLFCFSLEGFNPRSPSSSGNRLLDRRGPPHPRQTIEVLFFELNSPPPVEDR